PRTATSSTWPRLLPTTSTADPSRRTVHREVVDLPATGSSEGRDPCGLLRNHAGVVELGRPGGLAPDQHRRTGPHRHARAAAAASLVAHDVAPLGAVHVAVAVGERGHDVVHAEIVPGAD